MENLEPNIDLVNLSNIENIDYAIFDWLNKELNLFCTSKEGFKKVPVLWVTPERSYQIKNNKENREINGAITLPLMTIERNGIEKDQKNAATYYANIPPKNNQIQISRKINQKKTSEFANADFQRKYGATEFIRPRTPNKKIVYEFKTIKLPVYVSIKYSINIFTQFQQQMNEIIQPFATRTGSTRYFLIERDGYKYECFIEPNIEVKNNINSMEEEERRFISTISIRVLGNIISDGVNEKDSVIKTYENAVEIKIPRENIILAKEEISEPKSIVPILGPNAAVQLSSNVAIKKVFAIGNGVDVQYIVNHGLNSRDLYVSVRENFGPDYSQVNVGIIYTDLNNLTIDIGDVITNNSYVVTIIG
jgi:hypothetical protein